jgi:tetratricopeptide (TPR) repeat protein
LNDERADVLNRFPNRTVLMSGKTVFISYRRDSSGKPFARLLEQALTHEGYDVFLDVDDIDAGKWADQILTQVPLRAHFLLVLTPGALDRCADENDWVRQEFELAVKSGRNIVPVREESVDLGNLEKACPGSMKVLFDLQIVTVQHQAFERDVEVLIERYIPPHKAPANKTVERVECLVSPTRLLRGAETLFGREDELAALDQVWNDASKNVLTIVAFGGIGKTSLVIEWMAQRAKKNWAGFERVFDWSFFSQGTREQGGASADTFVAAALKFFGDEAMAQSAASAWDKGARLAHLVAQRRTLLVLDGVEPLQYPPGPLAGELKDPAVATLLKSLAQHNLGLCIATTRESVTDLKAFQNTTAPEWPLDSLSEQAGSKLLKLLLEPARPKGRRQVKSTEAERIEIVRAVKGHALTLQLLGGFIQGALGDVRKWREVNFAKADAAVKGGYAFKTMGAYEQWLSDRSEAGARQLAILRLLGLFNRPADASCVRALRDEPAITNLTEPLSGIGEDDWNIALSSLEECGLLSRITDQLQTGDSELETGLDAHPLIREYFASQLRENNPEAWRAANRRLYEHLCATTNEGEQPTLEDLQPLYQAIAHGCQAGLQQKSCDEVYFARIQRGPEYYSTRQLGALGSDLGAIACFFETPWSRVSPSLTDADQAWLLNEAATRLRATGRLTEALEPMRAAVKSLAELQQWKNAAYAASNLSELELRLGRVARAMGDAEESVGYADRSGDVWQRIGRRVALADARHQFGLFQEASANFAEAENIFTSEVNNSGCLVGSWGFRYCDLLLAASERVAWQRMQRPTGTHEESGLENSYRDVEGRAAKMLEWAERSNGSLLEVALDHLTLGRAGLCSAVLEKSEIRIPQSEVESAVDGLRRAGTAHWIPAGLLTRAWLRFLEDDVAGAQADLDEAWEIAERGQMKLFMADIHLYRARLFHRVKPNPWASPQEDLSAAKKLIEQCGYWRLKEELGDAETAAKNW